MAEFAARVSRASWFAAVGAPLTEAERLDAQFYLEHLGFAEVGIGVVSTWEEAGRVARAGDWNANWWTAEDERRVRLAQRLRSDGDAGMRRLGDITAAAGNASHGAAAIAAARANVADAGLIRAAAGAASTACFQAGLEHVTGDGDGPFGAKFRLFEAGHWPLCVRENRYYIF